MYFKQGRVKLLRGICRGRKLHDKRERIKKASVQRDIARALRRKRGVADFTMAKRIRVLDSANRTMQRLGYLKPLCALVNKTETSNLETLGKRLIECVTKRVVVSSPLDAQTREYVTNRLTHRSYHDLGNAVLEPANGAPVRLEIQDVCLADARLPSRTGKLAEASWRRYPYLGTSLELIRKGTYSPLTRSLVLLALTPGAELLKTLQKRDPAFVRFTVDRMGMLAYVKFLKPAPEAAT